MSLPTNYQNEILNAAMSNRRQYRMIENNNGTVSFVDVTVYDQEGSLFDADDVNEFAIAINLNITNIEALRQTLQNGVVNGIKGSAESNYRVGQVTISAADLGTLTEDEIRALISSGGGGIGFAVVDELPTTNISTSTIYLVPSTNSRSRNVKDEYVYISISGYDEITDTVVIVTDSSALPSTGEEDVYYITSDNGKVYTWDETNTEFLESETVSSSLVSELPSRGTVNIIYVTSNDSKAFIWSVKNDWEQIGSTSVNLTNYYTKSEIDAGALITTAEFQAM